jgi:hypothetical protein
MRRVERGAMFPKMEMEYVPGGQTRIASTHFKPNKDRAKGRSL